MIKDVPTTTIYNNHNGQFSVLFNSKRNNLQAHLFYQIVKLSATKWRVNIYFSKYHNFIIKIGKCIMSKNNFSDGGDFPDFDSFTLLKGNHAKHVFHKYYSDKDKVVILNDLLYMTKFNGNGYVHSNLFARKPNYLPDLTKVQNFKEFPDNPENSDINQANNTLVNLRNHIVLHDIKKHYKAIGEDINLLKHYFHEHKLNR